MDPQLLMARLRTLLGSMTPSQLVTLVMTFILVVAVVGGSSWFLTRPNFALVAVDLDPETASGVVAQLQTLNVPYQLDPGGRNVRVPAERVDELRLALTGSGVLTSGQVGWELFDQTSWSQTEFQEQVRMLRALEGEIGRTITSIGEVKAARVNLVIGKRSFIGESEPSKASVLLSLRGRDLPASSISGIANLVAASVPGLRPESVVIMDSQGRALLRPEGDGDDPLGPAQFERQQRMERQMETRIVGLLEPLVGTDRVKAIVALKLNPETSEVMTEEYDPDSVVIRSSSESNQQATSPNLPVGLAGSGGNIPPPAPGTPQGEALAQAAEAAAAAGVAPGPSQSSTSSTVNNDISKTVTRRVLPAGAIARLSVAVVIDDTEVATEAEDGTRTVTRQPRAPEEIQKLELAVRNAIGFEADRGDEVSVQNISFNQPIVEEVEPPSMLEEYSPEIWQGARIGGVVIVGLVALLVFVRPMMRRLAGPTGVAGSLPSGPGMPPPGAPLRTVADMESEIDAQIDAAAAQRLQERKLPVLTKKVSALAHKEPQNVAKLLKAWIAEPER